MACKRAVLLMHRLKAQEGAKEPALVLLRRIYDVRFDLHQAVYSNDLN